MGVILNLFRGQGAAEAGSGSMVAMARAASLKLPALLDVARADACHCAAHGCAPAAVLNCLDLSSFDCWLCRTARACADKLDAPV